jgi:hypothetical protein
VVNTPASYSGGSGFKSWPRDRLSWLRFLVVFLSPPGKCWESTLILGHAHSHIVSNSYFTNLPSIRRPIFCVTEKASLNKLQRNKDNHSETSHPTKWDKNVILQNVVNDWNMRPVCFLVYRWVFSRLHEECRLLYTHIVSHPVTDLTTAVWPSNAFSRRVTLIIALP